MIAPVASALGCARNTISEAMKRHPEIGEAVKAALDAVKDLAEEKLIKHIKAGHPWAIAFFLKTKAKDRGYGEQETCALSRPPLRTESTVNYSRDLLSVAERETPYALIMKTKSLGQKARASDSLKWPAD